MRQSVNGLGGLVQNTLDEAPLSGHLFLFRRRRGDTVKILWADADGQCLFTKPPEEGQFIWPIVRDDRSAGSSDAPAAWFALSPDLKGKHPQQHLHHFHGVLQADAFAG